MQSGTGAADDRNPLHHHQQQQQERHLVPVVEALDDSVTHPGHTGRTGHRSSSIVLTGKSLSAARQRLGEHRTIGYPSDAVYRVSRGDPGVRRTSVSRLVTHLFCCPIPWRTPAAGAAWGQSGRGRTRLSPRYYALYAWIILLSTASALLLRYTLYDHSPRVSISHMEQRIVRWPPAGGNVFCSLVEMRASPPRPDTLMYTAYKLPHGHKLQLDTTHAALRHQRVDISDEVVTADVEYGGFHLMSPAHIQVSVCCSGGATGGREMKVYVMRAGGEHVLSEGTVPCTNDTRRGSCSVLDDPHYSTMVNITESHHRGRDYHVKFTSEDSAARVSGSIEIWRSGYHIPEDTPTCLHTGSAGQGRPCSFYLSPLHREYFLVDVDARQLHGNSSFPIERGRGQMSVRCKEARVEVYLLVFCLVPLVLITCVHLCAVYYRARARARAHSLDAHPDALSKPTALKLHHLVPADTGAGGGHDDQDEQDEDVLYSKAKLLSLDAAIDNFTI